MSLRSYLFALIGGLIVTLTTTQLVLVFWIEKNLTEEVNQQARHLSEQVIELAFKNLDGEGKSHQKVQHKVFVEGSEVIKTGYVEIHQDSINENDEQIVKIKSKNTLNSVEPIATELLEKIKQEVENITVEVKELDKNAKVNFDDEASNTIIINDENVELIKKDFKSLIAKIHEQKTNGNIEIHTAIASNNNLQQPTFISHQWHDEQTIESKTKNLINYIQLILVICCIVALVAAYWLSAQFNKPLANLSHGFKKLSEGDYQHQVPEQGVQEIRTTISQFNDMVTRIDRLTKTELQHNEIKHLAELGEVSRGLAHALRNPIHTIGLSIEQLAVQNLSRDSREKLIKTVQNKISHIDKNIKALLTLTTNGINRQDSIPILAVVQDIILEYKSCQSMQQSFEVNINPDIVLLGAESEIRSILHTLIINACESNPSDGKVQIIANSSATSLQFIVKDEGCGLNEDVSNKLFQPHISTKPEGAGMGLYIAKRIISLHYQGDLTLVNNENASGCTASATFNYS